MLAAVLASAAAITPAAAAGSVPFTDPSAHGSIGLCTAAGKPLTSGSIYSRPFAPIAVSTTAAAAAYSGPGRKAILYAFQPRQGVAPSDWTGDEMSADSSYSNAAVPMVQSTEIDSTLADFMADYPPNWGGLLQLRMFAGHIGEGYNTDTYAASVLKVSGSTWTLLNPPAVSCSAGKAVSSESLLSPEQFAYYKKLADTETVVQTVHGPVSVVPPAQAPSVVTETPSAAATASSASGASGETAKPGNGSVTTAHVVPVTDLYGTKKGSDGPEIAAIAGGVAVAAAGARLWFWRRRRARL
jgi:hypothetical protein